ncbi:Threonyl-tRNA synthetase [Chlamydia trachomatis]|nr:Threonyl-tRNA synthetase [Chlamydia trachomatis]CRH48475.1 Threonyl-tRNA synthetase [Chlamydia trachomatis]CRH55134.1 Threonyl-tRNA synthetase [Chlamydia trachomatis]
MPITSELNDYCQKLYEEFLDLDINVNVDLRNERINKKIREAQIQKTKFIIVIGKQEVENNLLAVREYGSDQTTTYSKEEFLQKLFTLKRELK